MGGKPNSQRYPTTLHLINYVEENVVGVLPGRVSYSNNFSIVSKPSNAQGTFAKKPQRKKNKYLIYFSSEKC